MRWVKECCNDGRYGRGLGRAITEKLGRGGAKVAINYVEFRGSAARAKKLGEDQAGAAGRRLRMWGRRRV